MDRHLCLPYFYWLQPKNINRSLISAFCHMITITLISSSLVQLSWFQIIGGFCIPHLSVYTFFTFGYSDTDTNQVDSYVDNFGDFRFTSDYEIINESVYKCITPRIVNLMRTLILFCFMALIFALIGFFLDIIGPKSKVYNFVQKNSLPGACTCFWILAIIILSCYIQTSIEDSLKEFDGKVNYDYGFYAITLAGLTTMAGTISNILCTFITANRDSVEQNLLPNWEESETFSLPPPPPYSAPPPPYAP